MALPPITPATSGFNPEYYNNALPHGAATGTDIASGAAFQQAMNPAEYQALVDRIRGPEAKPNYGNALTQFGLNLMTQGGSVLEGIGNAGQSAMPLFQQETNMRRADKRSRSQDVMNLAIADIANIRKEKAATALGNSKKALEKTKSDNALNNSLKLQEEKHKDAVSLSNLNAEHKKDLEKLKVGATGPKAIGGVIIDQATYAKEFADSGDVTKALDASTIKTVPSSYLKRAEEVTALETEIASLDPKSPAHEYKSKVLEELRAQSDKNDNVAVTINPNGGFKYTVGTAGRKKITSEAGDKVWEVGADKLEAINEGGEATTQLARQGDHLLAVVNRNPGWATSGITKGGSIVAGFSDFVTEVTTSNEFAEDFGDMDGAISQLEKLAAKDSSIISPELVATFKKAGGEQQEAASIALSMAYKIAKTTGDSRVSDKDLAAAIKQLGYDGDVWFQDKTRVMRGIETAVGQSLSNHKGRLRGAHAKDWVYGEDPTLKAAAGFGWREVPIEGGNGTTWRWSAPAGSEAPAAPAAVTPLDDLMKLYPGGNK